MILSAIKQTVKRHLYPDVLHEGEVAPDWVLTGHDGCTYASQGAWSILIFYPSDHTPACTAQLAAFNEFLPNFLEHDCHLYGVNPGDQESHAAFAAQLGLRYPLLVDHGGRVAKQYQSYLELPLIDNRIVRTVYLTNPSRTIRLANRGTPRPEIILRSIAALKQAASKMM